ncbi:MAG: hypothetical protein HQ522_23725 [Bacteroidetes bacterium]|nr:hypothetical protein [Bacteroidota bacterium]
MMRRLRIIAVVFVALTTFFVACQKEDTGKEGPSTFGVKIEALNKSFSLPVQSTVKSAAVGSETVTWDSVHLVVSSIKLEAELKSLVTHEDSIEIEYKWSGPQLVNLLDNDLTLGNFMLQPGFYDEIELKVRGEKEDAGDNPVFYLEGTYTASTDTLPIMVKVNQDVAFKTERENVEVTEEVIELTSIIQLYLDQLMTDVDPVDLKKANPTDGTIVISADSNHEIYLTIMGNLIKDHHSHYKHKHRGDDHEHEGSDDDDDHNDDHHGGDDH